LATPQQAAEKVSQQRLQKSQSARGCRKVSQQEAAEKSVSKRLQKKSASQSISGGAALQRCDNRFVFDGGFSR
jgi:hypothetical protein